MKNKELLIILSQIPNNQHTYYTKNTIQSKNFQNRGFNRKITLLLEKSKKPEKSKNDTKQKVTTNETFLTTKTVQYAQKKYV